MAVLSPRDIAAWRRGREQAPRQVVVTGERVDITLPEQPQFEMGKATLKAASHKMLNELAKSLAGPSLADHRFIVEGHTDDVGDAAANEKLSAERARAVRAHLVSRGVPEERIEAVGYGGSRPVASNKSAAGRASNRRIEIKAVPSR